MSFGFPEDINSLAGTTNVGALTVLKAWTPLGSSYETLLFVLQNTDGATACDLIVETSEDGVYPDGTQTWTIAAAAGKQASLEVTDVIRKYWRVSAQTAGPTVAVKWSIRGVHRLASRR